MPIVKVQRPLITNDLNAPWLIYDESRKRTQQLPDKVVPDRVKKAMKGDFKAFFNAEWSSVVGWAINERVKDQLW